MGHLMGKASLSKPIKPTLLQPTPLKPILPDQPEETPTAALLALLQQKDSPTFPQAALAKSWTPAELQETVVTELALREAGRLIEKAREHRGITTRELAARAGVSQPRVMQIQSAGESLGIHTLVKFAAALGYKVVIELVPEEGGDPIRAS